MTDFEQLQSQKRALARDMHLDDALRRLQNNADFADVVLDGFLRGASLAALHASVQCRERDARHEALQKARAGAFLDAYFAQLRQRGDYARRAMHDMDAAISRARNTENG